MGLGLKACLKKCNIDPATWEEKTTNRTDWRQTVRAGLGVAHLEESRNVAAEIKHALRHLRQQQQQAAPAPANDDFNCDVCGRRCHSRIGLYSHHRSHQH